MGLLEFSWATISLIDMGVLSISIIGLWWLKNQVDRYTALSEELDKRCNALQQEHITLQREHESLRQEHITLQREHESLQGQHSTLQQEHESLQGQHSTLQQELITFQSTADRRYNSLLDQHNALQESQSILLDQHNTLQEGNATLRAALDAVTSELKALQTAHDRLSGRYDELVERVMPVFEILAREKLMEINARNQN